MRRESIIVVYGSNQAIAEEIADKLGAETLSVEHLSRRTIENSRSMNSTSSSLFVTAMRSC